MLAIGLLWKGNAMETVKCPYCKCRVSMLDVENDDGCCPECGAPLMGSMLFGDDDMISDSLDDEDLLDPDKDGDDL